MRAAMERLLDGRRQRTDRALTVSKLARVADGSRAIANRAVGLLAELPGDRSASLAAPGASRSASVRSKRSCAPCAAPRLPICVALSRALVQHIQVLTLQVAEHDAVSERLQQKPGRSGYARVVP